MEIKAGYKQTEIGVIPEDWEVTFLEDAVTFLDQLRKPIKSSDREKIRGIYPYYGASGIVDYVSNYLFDDELILLGEDGENILSRVVPLAFKVSGKVWVNNHAHVLKPTEYFEIDYLVAFLDNIDYSMLNSGTAQPKLNKQTCRKICIAKPSKAEQTAIATALRDVDELIAAQELLIQKKRRIKEGAMQQLLTGKMRLEGFGRGTGVKQTEVGVIPEDWEVKELRQLVTDFIVPMRDKPQFGGDIPWCRIEDFDGIYLSDSKSKQYVSSTTVQKMNLKIFPVGTLLVSCSANLGRCAITEKPLITNQTFIGLNFNSSLASNLFFYYLMSSKADDLNNLSSGTTISYLSREQFEVYKVYLPPTKAEQTAIAQVLSDMDEEIAELEGKLEKTRELKQGMMQQLLTGKIRLI